MCKIHLKALDFIALEPSGAWQADSHSSCFFTVEVSCPFPGEDPSVVVLRKFALLLLLWW